MRLDELTPGTKVRRKKGKYASGEIGTVIPHTDYYAEWGRKPRDGSRVIVEWPNPFRTGTNRQVHTIATLVPGDTPTHPDIVARRAERDAKNAAYHAVPKWYVKVEHADGRQSTSSAFTSREDAEDGIAGFPIGPDRSYPRDRSIDRVRVWIEEPQGVSATG